MYRDELLDIGLDLGNMTFSQLKQAEPNFFKSIIGNIVALVKFGKIMKIPELKF